MTPPQEEITKAAVISMDVTEAMEEIIKSTIGTGWRKELAAQVVGAALETLQRKVEVLSAYHPILEAREELKRIDQDVAIKQQLKVAEVLEKDPSFRPERLNFS